MEEVLMFVSDDFIDSVCSFPVLCNAAQGFRGTCQVG